MIYHIIRSYMNQVITTSFEVEHLTYLSVIIIVLIQYIEGLKVI